MLKRISHPYTCLVIIAVLLAITILPLHASDLSFTQCNAASSSGKYDEAITCYQKIIETRGYSAAVLYNLASSYAQSGNNGLAILNYERALRLAPSDPDILGNLEAVRKIGRAHV
jgi:tetratricopeptide (TPR) repeat protein